ncbi:hypothetical protein G4Y79_17185 [Phototrophicus methaneseepsis]|uniref:Uncharacterized protein n=1 Tax=Phototrophicus methaneseepsis TaxID=2710758 RepID=A0A7S8ICD2_9CHLR|nr:hypothetical protein [Phototrophicus methaneseepsis]QPC81420.1 hypothetical protein G4Y79_17185 [Phototrophicus methaneseepsis]
MGLFLRTDGDTSNTVIGIILLVMLLVFVGPTVIPRALSETFAFVDEAIPCERLRMAEDRGRHQSLIGVSSENPLSIRVIPDAVPPPNEVNSTWRIRIILSNDTIGTVPIVYGPDEVIVGDATNRSGMGLIVFDNANQEVRFDIPGNFPANIGVNSYPNTSIRLLGPHQRCVHTERIPYSAIPQNIRGGANVAAYYRITTDGVVPAVGGMTPQIYVNQGLDVIDPASTGGVLVSESVIVPVRAGSAPAETS